MARNYGKFADIRIPPESTGPEIFNTRYESVTLNTIGGTLAKGMSIVGQTSNATGHIEDINGNDVLVTIEPDSPVVEFTTNETVDIDDAAFTAIVNSSTPLYVNVSQLADGDHPYHLQRVSEDGSAHVRFREGEQQLDAFGITKVTSAQVLAAFNFQYSDSPLGLSKISTGSASATHLPNESSLRLDATTGATDSYRVISDQYFPYTPGVGREAVMTLACGDAGKANNIRRWGFFDDDNGVFFELNGTQVRAVIRSNVTGTPVETAVAQADWNGDVLDGTGGSDNRSIMNLDITKYNIYWVDYQWLGAGRVRFGVYAPNGERIVAHTFRNANANSTIYMTTGSLPLCAENVNSAITSGTSSLKITCGTVTDSKTPQVSAIPPTKSYTRLNVSVTTTETLLANFRHSTSLGSIDPQRLVSTGVKGTVLTETSPVVVRVYENATIGGTPSWGSANSTSPMQVDTAGTFSGGTEVASFIAGTDEGGSEDLQYLVLHLLANGTASKTYTVTAQSLNATTDVTLAFVWIDRG